MKRIILFLIVLLVAVVAAVGVYAMRLLTPDPIPEPVLAMEDAMAVTGLLAAGHVDIGHMLEVERIWVGEFDADALADGLGEDSLIDALWRSGVDPAETVDHWLVGFVAGEIPGHVQAVYGSFPVEALLEALGDRYAMEANGELWLLTREDMETCEVEPTVALSLSEERVIFGEPALVALVLDRLADGAGPDVDLGDWHAFRTGKTASFALVLPGEVAEATANPFAAMAAAQASEAMGDLRAVYLGIGFAVWPWGIQLRMAMDGANADWPVTHLERFTAWRDELVANQAEELPSLADLLDGIVVESEGVRLSVHMSVDETRVEQLGQVMSEGLSAAFGSAGFEKSGSSEVVEQTVPESELPVFAARLDPGTLPGPPTEQSLFSGPGPRVHAGPASFHLEARRLRDDLDGAIELDIAVETSRLPNLAVDFHHREHERIQLFVTTALGVDGRQLLAEETCGPNRNSAGADLQSGSDMEFQDGSFVKVAPQWSGRKSVRTVGGMELDRIAKIRGHLVLRLPLAVETIHMEAPGDGTVVERDGVRIVFKGEPRGDELRYEMSGALDRVLEVRARNAAGQALASQGASSSGRILRPGKSISRSFAGEIASVDLIFVTEEKLLRYPFELTDVVPHYADWTSEPKEPVVQSRADFMRDVTGVKIEDVCEDGSTHADVGPFVLCASDGQASWGHMNTKLTLFAPDSPAIASNLSALEVRLDEVDLRSGGQIARVAARAEAFPRPQTGWQEKHPNEELWLATSLEPDDAEGELAAVYGQLVHRLPRLIHPLGLDATRLGNEITYDNGVRMRLVEQGGGRLIVDVEGERGRVVAVEVLDADGERLPTRGVSLDSTKGDHSVEESARQGSESFRVSVEVGSPSGAPPSQLLLVYALEQDVWTETFAIVLEDAAEEIAAAR